MRVGEDRGGFTLAELAVVVMVVGILAGLAVPNLREALFRAEAASIRADANTVSVAAYEHLGDLGRFPGAGFGSPPPEMEPYLPENFSFRPHPDIVYFWFSLNLPTADNIWQTRNLGIFMVQYPPGHPIGTALQGYAGPDAYWTPTLFYVLYPG